MNVWEGRNIFAKKSEFGGMIVEDAAYGWEDISILCMEENNGITC